MSLATTYDSTEVLLDDFTAEEATIFYTMFGGHLLFQTLRSAAKFDLFSLLSERGSLTREQIATELDIQDYPARVLLLPLVTGGLLKKDGTEYSNSRVAEKLFVRSSPESLLAYVELQHLGMYPACQHLYESIKEGTNIGLAEIAGTEPTFYQRLAHDPDTEQVFQDAMQELSNQANKYLASHVDFSQVSHLVDVGGGDGTNAMTLAKKWPHLTVTVFDSPTVCEIAKENIRGAGMSDRVRTQPGNCFVDEFPTDADCFLFSHFFTIWSPEKDQLLLRKSFDALPSGGKVILFNMMQDDDETGPWSAAIGSPYFLALATGEGMLYTWQEYENWMRETGFADVTRQVLPRDHGCVTAIKG